MTNFRFLNHSEASSSIQFEKDITRFKPSFDPVVNEALRTINGALEAQYVGSLGLIEPSFLCMQR